VIEQKNNNNSKDYFDKRGIFLDIENLNLLETIFRTKIIKKESYFLLEGEKSTRMAMVTKGLFRAYYIDGKGNEITKYFYPEGSILFSYVAYLTNNDSSYCIQALEESEILTAKISDFENIMEGNYQLLLFFKKILDDALIMKEEHAISFKLLTNKERYIQFLNQYPGLEERIKQYQLASYLGITPVSLSRIRNQLDLIK
jgi:CRP-like cAMP-binding protein